VRRAKQVVYDATRYANHRDEVLESCKRYKRNNPEKRNAKWRRWCKENPEKLAAANLRHRERQYEWRRNHPEVYSTHGAKRRAQQLNATPPWVDKEHLLKIAEFYKSARTATVFHEEQYDVDHIEPLKGKTSCGLHVWWNLQVLPRSENARKHNKLIIET